VTRGLAEEVASESVRLDRESLRGCLDDENERLLQRPQKPSESLGKLGEVLVIITRLDGRRGILLIPILYVSPKPGCSHLAPDPPEPPCAAAATFAPAIAALPAATV
jgi:hypothetical protein